MTMNAPIDTITQDEIRRMSTIDTSRAMLRKTARDKHRKSASADLRYAVQLAERGFGVMTVAEWCHIDIARELVLGEKR